MREESGPARPGEELDVERLERFLHAAVPGLEGPCTVEQFRLGYSNLTYLLRCGGRELVLRRPPVGSAVKTAHDVVREHEVLSRLAPVYERSPRPVAVCPDPEVLGSPFYVMERIPGLILRGRLPAGFALPPETARRLAESFVAELARLHAVDVRASGLAGLGKPEGYGGRQVAGWTARWEKAWTDDAPDLSELTAWLAARLPAGPTGDTAALVHNDFKYDNLVLDPADPARIAGVLDWEMATVGDPLFDLGTSLGYWVEAGDPEPLRRFRFGPTDLPGSPTRRELAERYAELSGRNFSLTGDLSFYRAFGLFKIAVIAQQIYFRYRQGLTRDERFAALPHAIRALGQAATETAASPP